MLGAKAGQFVLKMRVLLLFNLMVVQHRLSFQIIKKSFQVIRYLWFYQIKGDSGHLVLENTFNFSVTVIQQRTS